MNRTTEKNALKLLCVLALLCSGCAAHTDQSSAVLPNNQIYAADEGTDFQEEAQYDDSGQWDQTQTDSGITSEMMAPAEQMATGSKMVYTANVEIQTRDFDASAKELLKQIDTMDGFVQSENLYNKNAYQYAQTQDVQKNAAMFGSYEVRIPADNLDSYLAGLSELGNIVSQSRSAENIAKNYYDTQSEIDSLKTEKKRLDELMAKAKEVSDMIAIEDQLAKVQQQLKAAQQDLSFMDLDLEYSTVWVSLDEVEVYTNPDEEDWGASIASAFENTWYYFGKGVKLILVGAIYLLPWALAAAVLAGLAWWLIRKSRHAKEAAQDSVQVEQPVPAAHPKSEGQGLAASEPIPNLPDAFLPEAQVLVVEEQPEVDEAEIVSILEREEQKRSEPQENCPEIAEAKTDTEDGDPVQDKNE